MASTGGRLCYLCCLPVEKLAFRCSMSYLENKEIPWLRGLNRERL